MKHYITLLSLLLMSSGFAQTNVITALKEVKNSEKQTLSKMKATANKAQNDALFDKFCKETEKKLSSITEEDITPYLDENWNKKPALQQAMNEAGLVDVWGEGMFGGFFFAPNYLTNTFKNYLSDEYLLYLKINDVSTFMFEDAGLKITWQQFADLLFDEGEFITKYPKSKKIKEMRVTYASHIYPFLFGTDNTPSHRDPKARKAMNNLLKEHPQTLAAPIVKYYLDQTKNLVDKQGRINQLKKYRALNLYQWINNELKKQLGANYQKEYDDEYDKTLSE